MHRGWGGPEMAEEDLMVPQMAAGPGLRGAPGAPAPLPPPPPPPGGVNTATAGLGGGAPLKEPTRVRSEFPEAWIWSELEMRYYMNLTVDNCFLKGITHLS